MGQREPFRPQYVLCVEDDPILMLALVDFVEEAGFGAVEATSIPEAISILEARTDIRTVFADLDMRGAEAGMKFAVSVRDRWPPIELLMISAWPWDHVQAPARGVLVGKPFDRRQIEVALRRLAS